MSWYAVYKIESGDLYSIGSVIGELPPTLSAKQYDYQPDLEKNMWDSSLLDFVSRPASKLIPRSDWFMRFTLEEHQNFIGYQYAAYPDTIKKKIAAAIYYINMYESISLEHPCIVDVLNEFVINNYMTSERRDQLLQL